MRRSGPTVFSLLVVLTAAACASNTAVTAPKEPATLRVDMADSGTTVSMHVEDNLEITLPKVSSPIPGAPSAWYLAPYPSDLLEAGSATPLEGRFQFVAKAKGSGEIKLFGGCWPGPVTDERPSCPDTVIPGASPSPATFSLTIEVT